VLLESRGGVLLLDSLIEGGVCESDILLNLVLVLVPEKVSRALEERVRVQRVISNWRCQQDCQVVVYL
jgi:hypothetical protein